MNSGTLGESSQHVMSTQLSDTTQAQRRQLRQLLRQLRRSLTPAQQQHAAIHLLQQFRKLPMRRYDLDIALYWPQDGEIDPSYIAAYCQQHGARLWLPVVTSIQGEMHFRRAPAEAFRWQRVSRRQRRWPSQRGSWGLREPIQRPIKSLREMDLLLMPLVGFSRDGARLGMGGGFYDRALAALRQCIKRPITLGLAHRCQEVTELPLAAWDQPADVILTDSGFWGPAK